MEATRDGVKLNREELYLIVKIFNHIYEKGLEGVGLFSQEEECFTRMLEGLNEE